MKKWIYYLHENGSLIGKNPIVVEYDPSYFDSPFVKYVFLDIDIDDQTSIAEFLRKAHEKGANKSDIIKIAKEYNIYYNEITGEVKCV